MRRHAPVLMLLSLLPGLAAAQDATPTPIRAWFGPTVMFATDLASGIGAGYDLRVTIERPDVVGVSVVLGGGAGVDEDQNSSDVIYGAFLVGRTFPVAEDAFLHVSGGLGYGQTSRYTNAFTGCDPYSCTGRSETEIGAIVPVRAELHVPYRRDRSFGIVAQAILVGDVPNRIGLGLHYSFGRNLSEPR